MSTKIKYMIQNGEVVELEVSKFFAAEYARLEREEKRRHWREKKRGDISLDMLFERGYDFPDPVNQNPEEMSIDREEMMLSVLCGLTEYQKRVAIKYFVEHKTHLMIAKEEGVSRQTISRLIAKVKNKIISQFF